MPRPAGRLGALKAPNRERHRALKPKENSKCRQARRESWGGKGGQSCSFSDDLVFFFFLAWGTFVSRDEIYSVRSSFSVTLNICI